MYRPHPLGIALAVGIIATAAVVVAQNQQQRQNPAQPGQGQQGQASQNDSKLAACLLIDNHGEVQLAKLAQQRAQSDDVKKFAQQMERDHSQFIDKLQRFTDRSARPQDEARQADQPRSLDFIELKQRIGQKCLEMVRAELEKKDGREFDQCYTSQQTGAHMSMLAALEVFRDYASPNLRPVLEEGIKTTEEHLKHAKQLAEGTSRSGQASGRTE